MERKERANLDSLIDTDAVVGGVGQAEVDAFARKFQFGHGQRPQQLLLRWQALHKEKDFVPNELVITPNVTINKSPHQMRQWFIYFVNEQ